MVHRSQERHERRHEAALVLLSLSPEAMVEDPAKADSLLTEVFVNACSFNTAGGGVDALNASGELGIIENEELRGRLASGPGVVADDAEDEAWIFSDVQQRLVPFLDVRIEARNI